MGQAVSVFHPVAAIKRQRRLQNQQRQGKQTVVNQQGQKPGRGNFARPVAQPRRQAGRENAPQNQQFIRRRREIQRVARPRVAKHLRRDDWRPHLILMSRRDGGSLGCLRRRSVNNDCADDNKAESKKRVSHS